MSAQIRRDPFARRSLLRRNVLTLLPCAWCGYSRTLKLNRLAPMFNYGWADDQNRPIDWQRSLSNPSAPLVFCSISCHDIYHD